MRRIAGFLLLPVLVLAADKNKPATAEADNEKVQITATVITDKDAIRQELGSDLGGYFVLARVEVTPKTDGPLNVGPDDFLLRSYKDGQKSQAFAPTQIAGRAAMVISSTAVDGGGIASESTGPAWGGIGGRPSRLPGRSPGIGNTATQTAATASTKTDDSKSKDDPLLKTLEKKILPQKETTDPVSGLLYFSLEGKHKPKDLVLQYTGAAGKLTLEFK